MTATTESRPQTEHARPAAPAPTPAAAPAEVDTAPRCRFCSSVLRHTMVDLGTSPLCQRHVTPALYDAAEPTFPLRAWVCHACFLVQLPNAVAREQIFDNQYAYFSSYSDTMLRHAETYAEQVTARFGLGATSRVVELASNDGYLLQYFVRRGIPSLGIEPTANTAADAEKRGVPTLVKFFGRQTAREVLKSHGPANLIAANNVLAHVPDLNDFVGGMKLLLAEKGGVVTVEFPQLLRLIRNNYWDTIYHEHYSYLSLMTVERIFAAHGMTVFDVEEVDTHGGSLRVYARHEADVSLPVSPRVAHVRDAERAAGGDDVNAYAAFGRQVEEHKRQILTWLIDARRQGKRVVAYGAPGKGNTLLNYCGIRTDFIEYTVDRSPHKQGNLLPASRIPIYAPEAIARDKPDHVVILVWNLKDEVMRQMAHVREWGGSFVTFMPRVEVHS